MGIDVKETGAILWKILGFSMNKTIKFMRNHPVLSGVFMFLLTLYIFLPSLLFFLIYSSPVLACAVVYAREKLGLRFSDSDKLSSSPRSKSYGGEKSSIRSHLRQQRSVRRNARMKVEEWDSQTSEEEKDKVILTSLYNDLLGRTPHFEESPKAVETDAAEENEKTFGGEDSGTSSLEPIVQNCEINEVKDREFDGKEETKEEISNVQEPGISEIERSRRLESLIARRRARRRFRLALDQRNKLQAEETTSPRQRNILQVTVPWNNNKNHLENRRCYLSDNTVMGLQIPSSAPSVMLQGRNPFDIPYDPQEERPDLTGDSFDEEFSLFDHKDLFFSRHESFSRFAQCMNIPVSASEISTTRKPLDNEYMDHTEQKLPCNGKEATMEDEDKSIESGKQEEREVEMNDETDSNKEEDDDSSGSEESDSEVSRLNKAELREAICHSLGNDPNFLVNQTRNSIPSPLPRAAVVPRLDANSLFYPRRCAISHSRTVSVASDMQVEVSEIGSPPTTVDWLDDWSNGGDSYMYDTDIEREIVQGEESRKMLSNQYESRSEIGSKEGNSESEAKPDQNEHLMASDDNKSQTEENVKQVAEDILEEKPLSSSKVLEHTNSGKFDDLFHTSVSLTSITEEPETILDSIDGGKSENMNYLTDQRSLTTMDSSMKNLIDAEVVDVNQNDDHWGSPKMIDFDIINHQQLNNIQGEYDTEINMNKYENTKPGEYEATQSLLDASLDIPYINSVEKEIVEEVEEPNLRNFIDDMQPKQPGNEAFQSDLQSSPSNVLTELLESEVMEENGRKLVENTNEKAEPIEQEKAQIILNGSSSQESNSSTMDNSIDQEINMNKYENTTPGEYEATQSLLDASLDTPYNNSFEREIVVVEEEPNLGNFIDDMQPKQPENEALQSDFQGSPSHVLTELLESEVMEEDGPKLVENTDEKAEPIEQEKTQIIFNGSSSQEGNSSTLDKSTDQEMERENSGLIEDLVAELTQEHNKKTNAEEESVISADIQCSQDSQPWTQQCDINASEGISPRTLEITKEPEHEDAIFPNTPFQENAKYDEPVAVAVDSAGSENNDEGNLKLNDQIGEDMEMKLELELEPMHNGIGLAISEDNEESKKVDEAMHNAQTETTKDENGVSED